MKAYICELAEVVVDAEKVKNPYIRLTFVDKNAESTNIFATALQRKPIIVVSGGYFTADNKPDKAKNFDWCKEMQPKFQGAETLLHEFICEVEPYYQLGADGKPKGNVLHTIGVTTFAYADEQGNPQPLLGENAVNKQAANRLANGSSMYITVAEFEANKQAEQLAAQVPVNQPVNNPFAGATIPDNPF